MYMAGSTVFERGGGWDSISMFGQESPRPTREQTETA